MNAATRPTPMRRAMRRRRRVPPRSSRCPSPARRRRHHDVGAEAQRPSPVRPSRRVRSRCRPALRRTRGTRATDADAARKEKAIANRTCAAHCRRPERGTRERARAPPGSTRPPIPPTSPASPIAARRNSKPRREGRVAPTTSYVERSDFQAALRRASRLVIRTGAPNVPAIHPVKTGALGHASGLAVVKK